MCEVYAEGGARLLEQRPNESLLQRQNGNVLITTCLVLARVENGKDLKRRSSVANGVYTVIPCAHPRQQRCHAVVLEGRISVLGDGGGEAELSRTIFGHT